MKKYELLLVLPGTLDEKEAEIRSNEVLALVKGSDEKAESHAMGKVRLAYPIKQIRYGYYYNIVFSVESADLKVLQNKFGLMRDLLRAIISVYNPNFTSAPKFSYNTETTEIVAPSAPEQEEKVEAKPKKAAETKVSMQDIDKKLDEIMSGDVISGV